jgi:hypothetical protein
MSRLEWDLIEDAAGFDLGDSGAVPGEYLGRKALYLEKPGATVWLLEEVPYTSCRIEIEVAIPGPVGFAGIAFNAQDERNYELVYLAPIEIQYDPIWNGSMTWQIYNGPLYQKPLPDMTGAWAKLAVEVHPEGAIVYLNDDPEPQLVLSNLQHGGERGRIGLWSFLPAYASRLTVTELPPAPLERRATDLQRLAGEGYVVEWRVSSPYLQDELLEPDEGWMKATVEENGTLNLNRLYAAQHGATVQVESAFELPEETETILSYGYSDCIRLWINGEEVHEGDWRWRPPASDGRIVSDFGSASVRWRSGINTIRAELTNCEAFGWGICVKTGLPAVTYTNRN